MPTSASGLTKPEWLRVSQQEAQERLVGAALPTGDTEAWRYTSLKNFTFDKYSLISDGRKGDQAAYAPPKEVSAVVESADRVLYFYNGVFLPQISRGAQGLTESPSLCVSPLSKALNDSGRSSEIVRFFLDRQANADLGAFGDYNLAHFTEGAFVHIKGSELLKIAVVHLYGNIKDQGAGAIVQAPFSVCPRQVYYFGENTRAEVIELHVAANNISFFVSSASDLILDRAAQVSFGLGQWLGDEAFVVHDVHLKLSREAELEYCNFAVASSPLRNEIICDLLEAGASVKLLSSYAATDKQHIDNSSAIFHRKGETRSEQVVKGVVSGSARAIFSGKLRIEQDAQRSDASQLNQNLLLSSKAEVDTRPQLEVYADDVKAAHGASVGELSADEIFYLESRGIGRDEAKLMLGRGYILDVIGRVGSTFVRQALKSMVERLPAHYFSGGE